MSERVVSAIDQLERAIDTACECTPSVELSALSHVEKHLRTAIELLEAELRSQSCCDNCDSEFNYGDRAYRIEKGDMSDMGAHSRLGFRPRRSGEQSFGLLLCSRCYDNNWIIGESDE